MTLKVKTLFPRCPTLFMSTLKYTTLLDVANFNVEIHNVDLTLSHVATWRQPKDNVETTLKCLLGRYIKHNFYRPHFPILYIVIGSKFGKNSFLLVRSFSRVSTRLLLLVYKTNFAKTNIAGRKCVGLRTCPQKLYYCSFWHTNY